MANSIYKVHEMINKVGFEFDDATAKKVTSLAEKAGKLAADNMTQELSTVVAEIGDIFNQALAKMGKEPIDLTDMIKMPNNATIGKLTSSFVSQIATNISDGIVAGINDGLEATQKQLKNLEQKRESLLAKREKTKKNQSRWEEMSGIPYYEPDEFPQLPKRKDIDKQAQEVMAAYDDSLEQLENVHKKKKQIDTEYRDSIRQLELTEKGTPEYEAAYNNKAQKMEQMKVTTKEYNNALLQATESYKNLMRMATTIGANIEDVSAQTLEDFHPDVLKDITKPFLQKYTKDMVSVGEKAVNALEKTIGALKLEIQEVDAEISQLKENITNIIPEDVVKSEVDKLKQIKDAYDRLAYKTGKDKGKLKKPEALDLALNYTPGTLSLAKLKHEYDKADPEKWEQQAQAIVKFVKEYEAYANSPNVDKERLNSYRELYEQAKPMAAEAEMMIQNIVNMANKIPLVGIDESNIQTTVEGAQNVAEAAERERVAKEASAKAAKEATTSHTPGSIMDNPMFAKMFGKTEAEDESARVDQANESLKEQSDLLTNIQKLTTYIDEKYLSAGKHLSDFLDDIQRDSAELDAELKDILTTLRLIDENGNLTFDVRRNGEAGGGTTHNGALISDDFVLIEREDYERVKDSHLPDATKDARADGMNVAEVLGYIKSKHTSGFFDVQTPAQGHNLFENGVLSQDVVNATETQLQQLVDAFIEARNHGFDIENGGSNIVYDPDKGFSFYDLEEWSEQETEAWKKLPEVNKRIQALEHVLSIFGQFDGENLNRDYTNLAKDPNRLKFIEGFKRAIGNDTKFEGLPYENMFGYVFDEYYDENNNLIIQAEADAHQKNAEAIREETQAKAEADAQAKKGQSYSGDVYHGSKTPMNDATYDPSQGKGMKNLGAALYTTPDLELAAKHGKNILKQNVQLDNVFTFTEEFITDIDDLYKAMGKVKPANVDWDTVKRDLLTTMKLPGKAQEFAKNMRDMGYQGMYSKGYGYADPNTEQLAIYDETYQQHLTTQPYNEIVNGAKAAEQAVDNLNESIKETNQAMQSGGTGTGDASSADLKAAQDEAEELRRKNEILRDENVSLQDQRRQAEGWYADEVAEKIKAEQRAEDAEAEVEKLRQELASRPLADTSNVKPSTDETTNQEALKLQTLKEAVEAVTTAVDLKTQAFKDEAVAVNTAVESEIAQLGELEQKIAVIKTTFEGLLNNIKTGQDDIGTGLSNIVVNVNRADTQQNDLNQIAEIISKVNIQPTAITDVGNVLATENTLVAIKGVLDKIHSKVQSGVSVKTTSGLITDADDKALVRYEKEANSKISGNGGQRPTEKINTALSALLKYRTTLQEANQLSGDLEIGINNLYAELSQVSDKAGLTVWNEHFKQFKNASSIIQTLVKDYKTLGILQAKADAETDPTKLAHYLDNIQILQDRIAIKSVDVNVGDDRFEEANARAYSIERHALQQKKELANATQAEAKRTEAENKVLEKRKATFAELIKLYEKYATLSVRAGSVDGKNLSDQLNAEAEETYQKMMQVEKLLGSISAQERQQLSEAMNKGIEQEEKKYLENMAKSMDAEESDRIKELSKELGKDYKKLGQLRARVSATTGNEKQFLEEQVQLQEDIIRTKQAGLNIDQELYDTTALKAYNKELEKLNLKSAKQRDKDGIAAQKRIFSDAIKESKSAARVTKANSAINKAESTLMGAMPIDGLSADKVALLEKYNTELQTLKTMHKDIKNSDGIVTEEQQKELIAQTNSVNTLTKEVGELVAEYQRLSGDNVSVIGQNTLGSGAGLEAYKQQLINAVNAATYGKAQIKSFDATTKTLTYTVKTGAHEFTTYTATIRGADNALVSLQGTTKRTETFLEATKRKIKEISSYVSGMAVFNRIAQELRQGIQYVREIDSALTELKKVTDETEEAYDRFLDTAAKTADKLGSTISAVTEATATFTKLGYSMEMASEMAEAAIVYKNVGDNIASTEDAADSIISTLKGFGLEASEAMAIVDRFNEVGE